MHTHTHARRVNPQNDDVSAVVLFAYSLAFICLFLQTQRHQHQARDCAMLLLREYNVFSRAPKNPGFLLVERAGKESPGLAESERASKKEKEKKRRTRIGPRGLLATSPRQDRQIYVCKYVGPSVCGWTMIMTRKSCWIAKEDLCLPCMCVRAEIDVRTPGTLTHTYTQ